MSKEKQRDFAFLIAIAFATLWAIDCFAFLTVGVFQLGLFAMRVLFLGFLLLAIAAAIALNVYIALSEDLAVERARIAKGQQKEAKRKEETCPACNVRTPGHIQGTQCEVCSLPF